MVLIMLRGRLNDGERWLTTVNDSPQWFIVKDGCNRDKLWFQSCLMMAYADGCI